MTDAELAARLAELYSLEERSRGLDARPEADEQARLEASEGVRGGSRRIRSERESGVRRTTTLGEVSQRKARASEARALGESETSRARADRGEALWSLREVLFRIASGLPENEWVENGEWALLLAREPAQDPSGEEYWVLHRALASTVRGEATAGTPLQILARSRDNERRRFPELYRTGEEVFWVLAVFSVPAGIMGSALLPTLEWELAYIGSGLLLILALVLALWLVMVGIRALVRGPEHLQPVDVGEYDPEALTAVYRLPTPSSSPEGHSRKG